MVARGTHVSPARLERFAAMLLLLPALAIADEKIVDDHDHQVACRDKALERLKALYPAAWTFVTTGNASTQNNFANSLDCDHPGLDYHITGGVHEAIHGASRMVWPAGQDPQQTFVSIEPATIATITLEPTTGRGVLFDRFPEKERDDYFATYMEPMPKSGFPSMLDETNAYAQDVIVTTKSVAAAPSTFVHAAGRDGTLRWLDFDFSYLEALEDPKAPDIENGEFPQRAKITKGETLAKLADKMPMRLAFVEIVRRARAGLAYSCKHLPADRHAEIGVMDVELTARLRLHKPAIEKYIPDAKAFLAEIDAGFGCPRLALKKRKPR